MVFVAHPVTWKVLCKPMPCCRHKQQLQEAPSCLFPTRAGTSLVPRRARLALLHSWEKEIFVYCPGSGGQATHHPLLAAAPVLLPGLVCLAASQGSLGPFPKLVIPTHGCGVQVWFPLLSCTWNLGLYLRPQPKC